ncbi:hypothetical protein [Streptomyces sp. NPDC058614]|uniref:hypothetical protein n=1 Tax=Streptomyces sp. NPDC058614 TaxID=3346557 RepID=UPI00364BB190
MTRSRAEAELDAVRADRERIRGERDQFGQDARACASQMERLAHELSRGKDVIATHMIAVAHPSTVLHSPQQCMESLREALASVGFDLRLELERLEGADL